MPGREESVPRRSIRIVLAFALIAGLVVIGSSQAGAVPRRYAVHVDATAKNPALAFLRFFPGAITVHRGDVIDFSWDGIGTPHTVTAVPDADAESWRSANVFTPGAPFEDPILDTAIGGDDGDVIENPAVANPSDPSCGTAAMPCRFNGSTVVNSGLQFPFPGNVPTFALKVAAPVGDYSFLCMLHPGMSAPLHVVGYGTPVPSPDAVARKAHHQIRRATRINGMAALEQSQQVMHSANGATLYAGGFRNQVAASLYPARTIRVHKGDHVRFLGTGEIHTATVPASSAATIPLISTFCEVPGPDTPAASPFDCASPADFQLVFSARAITPTATHGLRDPDRFVNTGLMFPGVNGRFTAKKAGRYSFVCLVHGPSMSGTIVVTP
jgi:plastocyanin